MRKKLLDSLFSVVALFSLLVNSLSAPLSVYAQEVTPEPTPIVEETPTPTPTEEPTITPEVTPTPTEEATPTPTEEVTPTPMEEVTPTPTPTETQTTQTDSQPSDNQSTEPETTPIPEVAVEETQEQGVVDAVILHNTSAASIDEFDFDYQTDGSATLTTDKADYSPMDTVLITGTGFTPNETYTLEITSDTGNFKFSDRVTSDESGNLFYSYQLDGTMRPLYKVEVKDDSGTILATTTFTDPPPPQIEYNNFEGEIAPQGSDNWTNGNISGYKEGDTVRFRVDLDSPSGSLDGHAFIGFTSDPSCRFFAFENPTNIAIDFNRATNAIDSGSGFTAALEGLAQSGNDAVADFHLTSTSALQVRLNFTLHLSDGAAGCASGSSQHVQIDHTSGDVKSSGNKALPIPSTAVAPVTDITVSKSASPTASIGGAVGYTLTVTNLDTSTTASLVVATDTLPAGVTFVSGSWTKTSPSGSGSCSAIGQVVTCNIGDLAGGATSSVTINVTVNSDPQICGSTLTNNVSVSTATLESDSQNNSAQASTDINACAASITVHKNVLNPDGGEVVDNTNFTVRLDNSDPRTINESTDATYSGLLAGNTYTVTEDSPSNHDLVSISPDGNGGVTGAQVTVVAGNNDVYVVNKQKKATINVYKDVVRPNGQSPVSDTHQFTALLNGGTGQSFGEGNPTSYTVNPGQYTISEEDDADYTELGCALETGGEATNFNTPSNSTINVTCKNAQISATITVYKNVLKYDGSEVVDGNIFSVTLNSVLTDFTESAPAVYYAVDPGTYSAVESAEPNYSEFSNDSPETVGSNGSGTIHIVNKQDPLSISGYKFDADEETGLEGWTIKLYSCLEDFLECSFTGDETTTDVNGFYTFTGLSTGLYQVGEVLKAGWTNLSGPFLNVDLTTPGQDSENNNFVNFENVSVTACKVVDADGDPQTLGDQTNKFGWTVNLLVDGQTDDTGTTEEDGCYTWDNLGPGYTYGVSEETPTGWTPLADTTHNFGPAESGSDYSFTFVNFENATIIVHKNVLGTDGITDVDDAQTFTSLLGGVNPKTIAEGTDATYDDLSPGTYVVSEDTPPSGYEYNSISNGGVVPVESGGIYEITITNKQVSARLIIIKHVITDSGGNEDAGNFTMNVTGTNVSDTGFPGDENGTEVSLDAGDYFVDEDPFDGYTKTLGEDCSGSSAFGETKYCTITNDDIAPTVTLNKVVSGGDAGENDFGLTIGGQGVDSGQTVDVNANTPIELNEESLDGYSFDSITGDEGCPSELGGTVALGEGESITCTIINTRDTGDIQGYKFEDLNGNGTWDEGEPGLDGWTIELWGGEEDLIDTTETSDDPLGEYRFENIPTGYYAVCEVLEEGWTQTYPEGCHFFTLTQEGEEGLNFGNFELGTIGDFIWEDTDAGGDQDPGEPGISGMVANLYLDDGDGIFEPGGDDGAPIATDTTDGTGGYLFENLGPGTYWVDIDDSTVPSGYANTTPDPVGPVTLSSNEDYTLADVGYVPPEKEISIEKFNDKSGGANAGDTVTYTLVVTNTGNVALDVFVTDVLPGGFSYVAGSANVGEPGTPEDGTLTWDIGILSPDESVTITYQAKISSDLTVGTYKNLATCEGVLAQEDGIDGFTAPFSFINLDRETVDCNVADSSVSISQSSSYGGQLTPQVLGAATELPATGSSTSLLLFALIVGGFGIFTKVRARKIGRRKYGKN